MAKYVKYLKGYFNEYFNIIYFLSIINPSHLFSCILPHPSFQIHIELYIYIYIFYGYIYIHQDGIKYKFFFLLNDTTLWLLVASYKKSVLESCLILSYFLNRWNNVLDLNAKQKKQKTISDFAFFQNFN